MEKLKIDLQVAIGHDYLLQYGGAERVVETWSGQWPSARISTLAYNPTSTFESFTQRKIEPRVHNRTFRDGIEAFLPILPILSKSVALDHSADVALVSTSGFAHHFTFEGPRLVYFHSPARWLYEAEQYRQALSPMRGLGLTVSSPYLRRADRWQTRSHDRVVANSVVTRDRIWRAYGIDSEIVNPPVQPLTATPKPLLTRVPETFVLAVARSRGYKNVELASDAAKAAGTTLVVAGSGSEAFGRTSRLVGLGRVTEGELRWLYARATAILLTGDEDYGLTGPEANFEGTPAVGVPKGGYLETINHGVNGLLALDGTSESLAEQLSLVDQLDRDKVMKYARDNFAPSIHMERVSRIMSELTQ